MENVVSVISALGTVAAIIFGTAALLRNSKKDNKNDGAQMAVVVSDIGYIKSSTDGINTRLDKLDDKQEKVLERMSKVEGSVAKVEESVASAHKRIDEIRKER